jgi:hypothetical protein
LTAAAISGKLANVSAANFKGGELASGMIVSAFGERLATGTAAGTQLPYTLLGTMVRVIDNKATNATLNSFSSHPHKSITCCLMKRALGPQL